MIETTHSARAGFSYIEVLLATVLIAVALVPAMESLRTGLLGSEVHASTSTEHLHLVAKVEEVLAQPFADLAAAAAAAGSSVVPTSFSDTAGAASRRLVFLAAYDGDNADGDGNPFTGGDPGLLWVRVEVEHTAYAMETLTSE